MTDATRETVLTNLLRAAERQCAELLEENINLRAQLAQARQPFAPAEGTSPREAEGPLDL